MEWPIDAHVLQAFQGNRYRSLARPNHYVEIHTPACHGALLDRTDGAPCQRRQARLGHLQRAHTDLAVGPMQLQFKGKLLPALPRILRQRRCTGGEIRQRGAISLRRLRTVARDQVELGYLVPLVRCRDQGGPPVQVIDDLEDRLLPPFRGNGCREQSSDTEMGLRTQSWRYH